MRSVDCAISLTPPPQTHPMSQPKLTWSRAVVFGRGCFSGHSSCFSWNVCTAEDRGRSRLVVPDFSLGSEGVTSPSKVCNIAGLQCDINLLTPVGKLQICLLKMYWLRLAVKTEWAQKQIQLCHSFLCLIRDQPNEIRESNPLNMMTILWAE